MFLYKYKNKCLRLFKKQPSFRALATLLQFQDERRGDLVPFLRAKKSKRPHPGAQILSQIPEGGKEIEVKCPTYAQGPPPPPPRA